MNIRQHTAAIKARQAVMARAFVPSLPYRGTLNSAAVSRDLFAEREVTGLRRELVKAGADVLGEGSFSLVVGISDRTVLKVSVGLNDGYHKYVPWVIDRRNRKDIDRALLRHLPVIHSTHVLPNGVRLTMMERLTPDWAGARHELPDALKDLLDDECERLGYHYDLHAGNVMCREDGTPVVTDPWAALISRGPLQ